MSSQNNGGNEMVIQFIATILSSLWEAFGPDSKGR